MLALFSPLHSTLPAAAHARTDHRSSLRRFSPFAWAAFDHFAQKFAPKSTLLIVEEQPVAARILAFALRHSGFRTLIAHNPREVDTCLACFRVDLLIVSLQPQRGGILPVVRTLREQARYQQLPILGMSSQPSYALERVALKMGVTRYIVRPLRPLQLANVIRELLTGNKVR